MAAVMFSAVMQAVDLVDATVAIVYQIVPLLPAGMFVATVAVVLATVVGAVLDGVGDG